jgi:hypothetical protein
MKNNCSNKLVGNTMFIVGPLMVTGEGLDYTPWCSAVDWAAVWVNI